MSGILIVSGRPRPRRMSASVKDAVPPPPRDLPHINPLIPLTLVGSTLAIVYFGGLLRVSGEAVKIDAPRQTATAPPTKSGPVIRYAPDKLPQSSRSMEEPTLLATVRSLAFLVASEPTSAATYLDRLDTLRSYFGLLTPVDRSSIFGVNEFAAVEQILKEGDPKAAYALLDRIFMRLQLTFR